MMRVLQMYTVGADEHVFGFMQWTLCSSDK